MYMNICWRFTNEPCESISGKNGTCFSPEECDSKDGTKDGSCASGYGVCCVCKVDSTQTFWLDLISCSFSFQWLWQHFQYQPNLLWRFNFICRLMLSSNLSIIKRYLPGKRRLKLSMSFLKHPLHGCRFDSTLRLSVSQGPSKIPRPRFRCFLESTHQMALSMVLWSRNAWPTHFLSWTEHLEVQVPLFVAKMPVNIVSGVFISIQVETKANLKQFFCSDCWCKPRLHRFGLSISRC